MASISWTLFQIGLLSLSLSLLSPNHQWWCAKMEAQSEYVHIAYTLLPRLGADSHAPSVLSNKISASEIRRKFVKSALLVGLPLSLFSSLSD